MALKIRQIKGTVGRKQNQRDTLRSLGLKRIGQEIIREDNAVTRGIL
ncbi:MULTISPECIES: 50S ribosomal protein L30 [Corynebacterium]|uniref:50S ribosomal protein L30 n=1 Tax=Corynebacterium aurimucosum TaxID=169292 RepID=A0A558GFY2_9CORY|nr:MULTISPECIES: 50S ribosomal protein L30 [Corynebacterium]TVU55786.1 50S ribosomal protein L30 [Corynebacterium aurimucosum]VDG62017.1 50S ribosomal protein L30 [Streptococcus thermophilus]MCG7250874.1 50S ribosomal protein L30 [Corynebacterium striatum]MDK2583926.1 50S ribosomal protein L30 [Corynebacterium sp. BWA136]OFK68106.1 50S ribosomal protein L30 [Corynebacterium sp. HMSC074A09]